MRRIYNLIKAQKQLLFLLFLLRHFPSLMPQNPLLVSGLPTHLPITMGKILSGYTAYTRGDRGRERKAYARIQPTAFLYVHQSHTISTERRMRKAVFS